MDPTTKELWTAGGVLLGFQVSALWWRIQREATISVDTPTWICPADRLNLLAMVVLVFGVFFATYTLATRSRRAFAALLRFPSLKSS